MATAAGVKESRACPEIRIVFIAGVMFEQTSGTWGHIDHWC